VHQRFAKVLDEALDEIADIRGPRARRSNGAARWPMIIMRTPKGWTGPRTVDGKPMENSWPRTRCRLGGAQEPRAPEATRGVDAQLQGGELFDENGALIPGLAELPPKAGAKDERNPHANGGVLLRRFGSSGTSATMASRSRSRYTISEATKVAGTFMRDISRRTQRISESSEPDETLLTASRRLRGRRQGLGGKFFRPTSASASEGRVMEVPFRDLCQGWLEGYLLTGRNGLFNARGLYPPGRLDVQPARQVAQVTRGIPWPGRSLAHYLLTSHVWRQDHNGLSHQDPRLHRPVVNKKSGGSSASTYHRSEHASLHRSTTACAAATTST